MDIQRKIIFIFLLCFTTFTYGQNAVTQPIPLHDLSQFNSYSPIVKKLIIQASDLTQKNLTYLYGSSDPANKGMDCSGTIYYLLKHVGVDAVPRSAYEMYNWVEQKGNLHKVHDQQFNSKELEQLKPGDLLFWTGTYAVKHNPAISHVMLYLGKNLQGKPIIFGASDGRTYQGKKMWGVSVFDFTLSNGRNGKFVGYSCIPELTCNVIK